ncbi:MAG: hypothetical protein U9N42_04525 [Campylobacterota bacterium]|nr:hypothetical protein [Campylobacterota bacterium]
MEEEKTLKINQESMDVLIANVIPTTKYFESRFDHLQYQVNEFKTTQKEMDRRFDSMQQDMDKRFDSMQQDMDRRFDSMQQDMDKRFDSMQEDIDKRFEQVDRRFEQVDRRFEQVDVRLNEITNSVNNLTLKIEELAKQQETTIRDYIIERDRHYDSKFNSLRMFNLATITLVAGVILKMSGIIQF